MSERINFTVDFPPGWGKRVRAKFGPEEDVIETHSHEMRRGFGERAKVGEAETVRVIQMDRPYFMTGEVDVAATRRIVEETVRAGAAPRIE